MAEVEELKEQIRLLTEKVERLEAALKSHSHSELATKSHVHPGYIPVSERRM